MPAKCLEVNKKKENRLSRRLTVDTAEPYVSIRPIIKSMFIFFIVFKVTLTKTQNDRSG